jgi:hypothetical protein
MLSRNAEQIFSIAQNFPRSEPGLGGWRSYEMVLRCARLAPEKLSSVASRIERQPEGTSLKVVLRGKDVAENATFSLRSVN